jgi:hypothetical protein
MATIKSVFGYSWAALCMVIVLATFFGMGVWPRVLANTTGVRVSPWYSGGDVAFQVDHGAYSTLLRKPVFDGLFAPRREGFVQIDWIPKGNGSLPASIEEALDVDGDGTLDLNIRIDSTSGSTRLTPLREWVLDAEKPIVAGKERIVRIRIRNH